MHLLFIAILEWRPNCVAIATEEIRLWWPGNFIWGEFMVQTENIPVTMVTELCSNSIFTLSYSCEFHTTCQCSANFEKSQIQIFSNKDFFLIWVLRPVKIISLILSRVNRLVGRKRELSDIPEKKKQKKKNTPPSAGRTWLVTHVTRARLEPTAVRWRAI